ncbi:hypothetical protein BCR35DRAFT_107993 [Leucosporidium creatinivorum]|uniref:Uncharacterized protein n=1 Tax=Leucosporidium creatinivorum TaxID=106004 RepID=A0A1Y2G1Q5_9BASI|nr:hypothetical protein BCR35DRAFT_107993 [Leucosporidium creatinivorum]
MLHRGLATMDVFTSAASLTDAELAQLATAEDTDVIAVQPGPKPTTPLPEIPAPTLGALNPRPIARAPAPPLAPPEPTPVTLLYYDPYQSFAPSYDSTASTLSYSESTTHRLSKTRLKRWEDDLALVDSTPFPPPIASTSAIEPSPKLELTQAEKELLREAGVESEEFEEGWEGVERQLKVWDTLQMNGELLGDLMRGQWRRLREGVSEAGPGEAEAASRLYDSFSTLLASRPRSSSSTTTAALVPSASSIHSALPTLLASMAREPAYQGTLDPQNQRAVKESAMVAGGVANGQQDQVMGGY